jgi:hypothetical protein
MKLCIDCGKSIPARVMVDGKIRHLSNRRKCFICSPFLGYLAKRKTAEERRLYSRTKSKNWYEREKKRLGRDPIGILRIIRKSAFVKALGSKCMLCTYDRCINSMHFHHVDESTKKFEVNNRNFQYKLFLILEELKKCILVCANCHGEIHADLISSEKINQVWEQCLIALSIFEGKNWCDMNLNWSGTYMLPSPNGKAAASNSAIEGSIPSGSAL